MNRHFILFAIVFAAALSGFAKTFDVDISTGRPAASNEAYYHGETIEFRAVRGRSAVTNIEYAAIYYQTNGMGDVWWRTDGLTFHPTNDVGAASYRFFMEGRDDLGRDWHANGLLRLLPSPGFTPNEITMPVATLDFATVDVLNPPWTDPDYSTSNTELVETIEATAPAPGDYAAVSNAAVHAAITNALQDAELESLSGSISTLNDTKASKADATLTERGFTEWSIAHTPLSAEAKRMFSDESATAAANDYAVTIHDNNLYVGDYFAASLSLSSDGLRYAFLYGSDTAGLVWGPMNTTVATRERLPGYVLGSQSDKPLASEAEAAANRSAISSLSDSISTLSDTASTVSSGLAQLADEAAPAINGYARLYSFVTGSTNANFVVTNYQLTAEAEAARTHFDPSDPELDFSTVPPSLRIEDASSGTNLVVVDTRDFVVWYWAQKIGGAIAEAVSTAVDTCRAWCSFTATGLENPIPDTLVIDVPNIWLMAGKTFEKHVAGSNACWVIRSNGVTMPISDNAQSAGGFLELTDAFGTPYIRFNKTENYFVDPVADGIEYDKDIGEWRILYSTTNCPAGGANAAIEGSTTYPGKAILKAEDDADCPATITWTGSANNWVMHAVPKPIDGAVPKSMFFGAVVEVQGQDYIEYLRPMSIPHLLVDGVKIAPDIPASHPVGTVVPWKVVQ